MCHVCVLGVTVITVILGKVRVCVGGGEHELCTFASDYSAASLRLTLYLTESFAPAVARLQRLISGELF